MKAKTKNDLTKLRKTLFLFIILITLTFQGNKISNEYYIQCANLFERNPLDVIGKDEKEINKCYDQYYLKDKALLLVEDQFGVSVKNFPNKENAIPTWLPKGIVGKNAWLDYLAMVRPDLEIISADMPNLILFAGKFGDPTKNTNHYAAWVWKFAPNNPNTLPKQLKFIDLYAGDEADRLFVNYLKIHVKNKAIHKLLQDWSNSGQEFEIKAILSQKCVLASTKPGTPACERDQDEIMAAFGKMNAQSNLPECTHSVLGSISYQEMNLLVKKGDKFFVQNSNSEIPVAFQDNGKSGQELRDYALVTILCNADCNNILHQETKNGANYLVLGCNTRIIGIKTKSEENFEIFSMVRLVDSLHQEEMVSKFNTKPSYANSIIQKIAEIWIEQGKKYSIKAYARPDDLRDYGGFDDLFQKLEISRKGAISSGFRASSRINYLLQDEKAKDYYQFDDTRNPVKISNYGTVASLKNKFLAMSSALDKDVKFIKHGNLVSFVFKFQNKFQLWSCQAKPFGTSGCQAPLQYLFGAREKLSQVYSEVIRTHSTLFDNHLKGIIEDGSKIRQIYPLKVDLPNPYSPEKILGSPDSTDLFPPKLEDALSKGSPLQFLIQKNDVFQIIPGRSSAAPWIGQTKHTQNPWLAWLCMADPSMEVVADNDSDPLRICMMSRNDDNYHLWSWVSSGSSNYIPKQYLLIQGTDKFFLTEKPLEEYTKGLYGAISDGEKQFFLQKADQPASFKLMDFLPDGFGGAGRVLLWKDSHSKQNYLSKVGNVANPGVPIYCFLPEPAFQWDKLAQRYNKEWVRTRFASDVAKQDNHAHEVWFGEYRIGIMRDNQVGVFLPPGQGFRNFGYANFQLIKNLEYQEKLVYKPRETNGASAPAKEDFFRSWVNEKWDREIWRANPLGFFDRVLNSTSTN